MRPPDEHAHAQAHAHSHAHTHTRLSLAPSRMRFQYPATACSGSRTLIPGSGPVRSVGLLVAGGLWVRWLGSCLFPKGPSGGTGGRSCYVGASAVLCSLGRIVSPSAGPAQASATASAGAPAGGSAGMAPPPGAAGSSESSFRPPAVAAAAAVAASGTGSPCSSDSGAGLIAWALVQ